LRPPVQNVLLCGLGVQLVFSGALVGSRQGV